MKIDSHKEGSILIVSVSGRLDATTADQFDTTLGSLMAENKHILMDLAELEYISSAGLRSILTAAKKMVNTQGTFALSSLSEMVKEIFDMSGFGAIINIHRDSASACTTLQDAIK